MHGEVETSSVPRLASTLIHLALFTFAILTLLGALPGNESMDPGRRIALLAFGLIFFVRLLLTNFVLLKRRFEWGEASGVIFAIAVYQVGFPLLAMGAEEGLGALDLLAIVLFLVGGFLNTGSEFQRLRFKLDPANKGKLYTGGLFRLSRHVNYFGDSLWVTGWALLTRNLWAGLIPLALTLGFVFAFIPSLSKHLSTRYGDQYEKWRRETKAFIPFVY